MGSAKVRLKLAWKPRSLGWRKSIKLHRSTSPFCTGVPVKAMRHLQFSSLAALAAAVAGFFIRWASSTITKSQALWPTSSGANSPTGGAPSTTVSSSSESSSVKTFCTGAACSTMATSRISSSRFLTRSREVITIPPLLLIARAKIRCRWACAPQSTYTGHPGHHLVASRFQVSIRVTGTRTRAWEAPAARIPAKNEHIITVFPRPISSASRPPCRLQNSPQAQASAACW
mmetsp:Transcript_40195/g.91858  ORF Transcript_40195/g.91858 Transcript_40195/m.91858 type:complete len:230 (-) Transcript_40195:5-694(-)